MMSDAEKSIYYIIIPAGIIAIIGAVILSLVGCSTPSASNANATNPIINPEIEGENNVVNTETKSETTQKANSSKYASGDGSTNNIMDGMDNETKGAIVCFLVFIILLIFLVKLEIIAFYSWVIFASAMGIMTYGIYLLMNSGGV